MFDGFKLSIKSKLGAGGLTLHTGHVGQPEAKLQVAERAQVLFLTQPTPRCPEVPGVTAFPRAAQALTTVSGAGSLPGGAGQ